MATPDPQSLQAFRATSPPNGLALPDEPALVDFAAELHAALAEALRDGPVRVSLIGELGAGKSALARALIARFGHPGPVKSPTYTLFETYRVGTLAIAHVDLYRLTDPDELEHIGFDELVSASDLLLIEWAVQGGARLPAFDLAVRLEHAEGGGRTLFLDPPA